MKNRICTATGLRQYTRHQDAEKQIGRAAKQGRGLVRMPRTAFHCLSCRRWHLTTLAPREARRRPI